MRNEYRVAISIALHDSGRVYEVVKPPAPASWNSNLPRLTQIMAKIQDNRILDIRLTISDPRDATEWIQSHSYYGAFSVEWAE